MPRFYLHASTTNVDTYIERAKLAEELNYTGLLAADGQMDVLDPYQLAALTRFVAPTITVGTATTNIVFRDPTLLAGEVSTANQITGGRFLLGIATGDSAVYQLGRKPTKLADMEVAIRQIRTLLAGGSIPAAVGEVRIRYAYLTVPLYMAVDGPKGLTSAGRVADGVMMGSGFDLDVIEWSRSRISDGAREAGRDLDSIDLMAAGIVHIDDDGDRARNRAKTRIANRAHHNFRLSLETVPEPERDGVRRFMDNFDINRPLEERVSPELVTDYLVQRFSIAGTPEECIARVKALSEIGIESFLLTPPEAVWEEDARRWAEEVMPFV